MVHGLSCSVACGILVPQPGIKPVPPAVKAWSLNHWTAKEVPKIIFLIDSLGLSLRAWGVRAALSTVLEPSAHWFFTSLASPTSPLPVVPQPLTSRALLLFLTQMKINPVIFLS